MGLAAGAVAVWPTTVTAQESKESPGFKELGRKKQSISLTINGKAHKVDVEPRSTLLDVLRETLDMTGSKEVCNRGACSACTVLLDGVAVSSCMTLAMDAQGHDVVTIEGLAADPRYKYIIDAFVEHDAAQCGYCIPGFVVRTADFLEQVPSPDAEQIREGLAGNLCRCGTYSKIFAAVEAAAAKKGGR
ncbi:(2Fe-2S)-binding protein [bacterium]|nr:(2Fe-2S)-binding protein [bacterium]